MLKIAMVTLGVAALVAVTTPMAATAATPTQSQASSYCSGGIDTGYANGRIVTVDSPLVSAGETFVVTWSSGYFTPGTPVTVSAGGNEGSVPTVTVGSVSGSGSATGTADGAGGLTASIAVPTDASGRIDVTATAGEACGGVSVTIIPNTTPVGTVLGENETGGSTTPTAVDPASETAASNDTSAGDLASTGGNLPTVLLVSGGAAVVFGAILIGARTRARRHMQE